MIFIDRHYLLANPYWQFPYWLFPIASFDFFCVGVILRPSLAMRPSAGGPAPQAFFRAAFPRYVHAKLPGQG